MIKKEMRLSVKLIGALIILGLLLTISISVASYSFAKNLLQNQRFDTIKNVSSTAASLIDSEDISVIMADGGDTSPEYEKVKELLNKIKQDNGLAYLVLHIPTENYTRVLYEAMIPEDNPEDILPYNYESFYEETCQGNKRLLKEYKLMYENFISNSAIKSPMITDDQYGYLYAAYASVVDENSNPVAMIDATVSMDDVRDSLNRLMGTIALISTGVIVLLLFGFTIVVQKVVISPIKNIYNATNNFITNDKIVPLDITIKSHDELGTLAKSVNYMTVTLAEYVDNLTLITAEKERIGAELSVATNIQASMLPCTFPAFPEREDLDIYASMTPAKEVGGDFYDFFLIDQNHLAMVMADVSGKGVPAALFMVIAKTLLKNSAQSGLSPKEILEKVNAQLCENNEAEMFVTVWIGILNISTGKIVCANAGHEYPVLKRANGNYELLKDKHGFVLAGMDCAKYTEYELDLAKGDKLFLYTDGVAEATNSNNELFGTDRMVEALNSHLDANCKDILHLIKADVDAFVGDAPQFDDITMLAVELK